MNTRIYILSTIIIVSTIFIYGKMRCANKNFVDPLSHSKYVFVDGWLLSHYIVFALAGYYYPQSFCMSMILGILWEVIEVLLGVYKPSFLNGISNCDVSDKSNSIDNKNIIDISGDSNVEKEGYWWYGRYEDIVVDFLGFVTGYFVLNYKFVNK